HSAFGDESHPVAARPGMTFNPWPSSDWVAFVAERGVTAAVLLALAVMLLARGGGGALLPRLAAAVVAGAFDAVLLLAAPALIIWTALGALWTPPPGTRPIRGIIMFAVVVLSAIGAARSAAQLVGMEIYAIRGDRASLERAARIDPGGFRLHLRLARGGRRRCEHALAARALYPASAAAREASRGCR